MNRILHFTSGPEDWKSLLAKPDLHWKTGRSARTLAYSWEGADGFPPEVARALEAGSEKLLAKLEPILAIPEFKVPLPGGERPSQNDLFVLAKADAGPVVIMVEGKVSETFGPTLGEWELDASPGKATRRDFLLRTLGLVGPLAPTIRYQLLHRAASGLIVAEQYRATAAVLLAHSFCERQSGWSDYAAFVDLFGVKAVPETAQRLGNVPIPLFAAWAAGDPAFLKS